MLSHPFFLGFAYLKVLTKFPSTSQVLVTTDRLVTGGPQPVAMDRISCA